MIRASRLLRFAAPEGVSNRLLLSMGSPAESMFQNKPIDTVTIPGFEGEMTLANNHSQLVSMLKPGVITVREGSNKEEFFVSDGWVIFSAPDDDSGCCKCEVSGVELVPVDALDKDRATQILSEVLSGPKES